ncbi:neuronal acetylcholine receptor subunit alpha-9-II-like isoform X2 [Panonychus citri]|uniref:neuronal acetylcholine receptor subunit alpha-9-II-like isoform X2 n=1 Tax=Panonychus citri TaxID=50023 RepID=UPI002307DD06|nr:neuronal acetylcholine receptor subunit alpha-9-II-like isoform X2 [Panonychus citri]
MSPLVLTFTFLNYSFFIITLSSSPSTTATITSPSSSSSSSSSCVTSASVNPGNQASSKINSAQLVSISENNSELQSNQSESTKIDEDEANQTNDERRLLNYLMRNYEKNSRPVKNAKSPIVVRLGITLTQIFDLEWVDDFLTWDVEKFGNVSKIRIPCELIWLPDIVLYNSADDYTRGYMNSRAIVEPNGNVFWAPPTKFRSTCPVDVTYFPFDDQTCYMKFGSWIYDGFQVDLCNRTAQVDLENYVHNGEWDLLEAKLNRNVIQFPCCIEPFPDIKILLTIRRKTLYYMYNIVLPCMMMSILTLLVFCLPPDSGEKVALGVTVLLAFSVIMLAISEKLPETSESIPLLGIYLTTVMAITSVSVIMTVIVLNFHYRGPTQSEMPDWLKNFLLQEVISTKKQHHDQHLTNLETLNSNNDKDQTKFDPKKNFFHDKFNFSNNFPTNFSGGSNIFSGFQANMDPGSFLSFLESQSANYHSHPHYTTTSTNPDYIRDNSMETSSSSTDHRCNHHHPPHSHHNINQYLLNNNNSSSSSSSSPLDIKFNQQYNSTRNRSTTTTTTASATAVAAATIATATPTVQNDRGQNQNDPSSGHQVDTPQEEIVKILKYLLWRQEQEDRHNKVIHEWRLLAQAIDKILFWIFLAITLTSSISFLVIIPIQRRGFSFASIRG